MRANREERRVDTAEIRASHPLEEFLEREMGVKARKRAGYFTFHACPKCGESKDPSSVRISVRGDQYMCFSCPDKGDVIHAAEILWQKDFLEAAQLLGGGHVGMVDESRRQERSDAKRKADEEAKIKAAKTAEAIRLIQDATSGFRNEQQVLDYLTKVRRLPLSIVRQAQDKKMIGFLPANWQRATDVLIEAVGVDLLRDSGLWKPDSKLPGIAYRPLVSFLPRCTSAEFRLIDVVKEGWQKSVRYGLLEYPYWWEGEENGQGMACEGYLDVLSGVALGFKGSIMGIPGCNSMRVEWFLKASEKRNIKRWIIGLDNDVGREDGRNPGQEWALRYCEVLKHNGLVAYNHPPTSGDLNDVWRAHPRAQ